MLINDKEKFIRRLKLNSNINKFIFAKTLIALNENATDKFFLLVANAVMNRFLFDVEISDEIPDIVKLLTSFRCWKNTKFMDSIDIKSERFKFCLNVADKILSGNFDSEFSSVISFHKKSENHLLTDNISPIFQEGGFSFFDVYV